MNSDQNALIAMLSSMNAWTWLIIGVVVLVAELFTGTLFLLWPAVAALIVGVTIFILPLGWEMQLLLFSILSVIGLFWGEKYLRPRLNRGAPSDLNDRAQSMIGSRVKAVSNFDTGRGRVKVGDTEWSATIKDGNPKKGDELRIVSVSGASVVVEAV